MSVGKGETGQMEFRSKEIVHLEIIFSFQSLNKAGGRKSKSVKLDKSSLIFGVNTTQYWLNYKGEKQLFDLSRKQKIVGQLCLGTSQGP